MKLPLIETEAQAGAMGKALNEVFSYDLNWAVGMFLSSLSFTFQTGPEALNAELQNMWTYYWTPAERTRIYTLYISYRLER